MHREIDEIILRIDASDAESQGAYRFTVGRYGDFNPGVLDALRRRGFVVGQSGSQWYAHRANTPAAES